MSELGLQTIKNNRSYGNGLMLALIQSRIGPKRNVLPAMDFIMNR
jgi:hypothetical protein